MVPRATDDHAACRRGPARPGSDSRNLGTRDRIECEERRTQQAVHAAYGWPYPLGDEEILERLIAFNLNRSQGQGELANSG
jgi:hypothetical protein